MIKSTRVIRKRYEEMIEIGRKIIMSNQKLSDIDIYKIQKAVLGLEGRALSNMIGELVKEFSVGRQRIYEVTKSQRPNRKSRLDKGHRKKSWTDDSFLHLATQLVITKSMKPEDAYEKAKEKGYKVSVALATFKRHLKEDNLWSNKKPVKVKKVEKKNPTIVILDNDLAKVFNDSETVNQILRALIPTIQKQAKILHQQKQEM